MTRLDQFGSNVSSQFGENGMIEHIFQLIGVQHRVAVEFGAGDGVSCSNTAPLWRSQGWRAVLVESDHGRFEELEGNARPFDTICRRTLITPKGPDSISAILAQEDIAAVDFMSIDVDGDDIFIFEALTCRPRVVSIEFNPTIPPHLHVRQAEPGGAFGASALALIRVGETLGYRFVGASYCNAFFVLEAEARPFARYVTDPAVLFGRNLYTYAVTDFAGRMVLVGQSPPWGPNDPYVLPIQSSGYVTMPTNSVQQVRRGFESLWGPAVWLTPNGLSETRYAEILTARPKLVCVDLTSVPVDSDLEKWLFRDAEALGYRPLLAGRILGLINKELSND